jgi:DNA-binding MarR family transcriptional regulator
MSGKLLSEIKQTKPFTSESQEAFLLLLKTTDQLRRSLSRQMEGAGVTLQQYNVLRILRGAGTEGLPTLEIANRMIEETPGITRLIDRLEDRGWVERERSATDRRQVICRLSETGRALLAGLDDPIEAWLRGTVRLPGNRLAALVELLEELWTQSCRE